MEEMNIEEDTGKGLGGVPTNKNHRSSCSSSGVGGGGVACQEYFTTHVDRVPSALTWAIHNIDISSSRWLSSSYPNPT